MSINKKKGLDNQFKFKINLHRGDSIIDYGLHSRVTIKLDYLSTTSLLVLAYIDMDQYTDLWFKRKRPRRITKTSDIARVLQFSKRTINRAIKDLEDRKIITTINKGRSGKAYIANILKLSETYQIITYSYISRSDISNPAKALILKIIMLGTYRITNIGNIKELMKETGMSRKAIRKSIDELDTLGYVIDSDEDGIYALDVEGIMLDSKSRLVRRQLDLEEELEEARQSESDKNTTIQEQTTRILELLAYIEELKDEIVILKKKINTIGEDKPFRTK